ncbi:MAG TPA: hypothetical protein VMB50_16385 [Myxococcales bacterium]|nr:hypothetical protein [Myxococcales bacterium]
MGISLFLALATTITAKDTRRAQELARRSIVEYHDACVGQADGCGSTCQRDSCGGCCLPDPATGPARSASIPADRAA